MIELNEKMVAYGHYYITLKECDEWVVSESSTELFRGTYDECVDFCRLNFRR